VVFGPIFAAWALILTFAFGLRNPHFPSTLRAQRIVIGISAVLFVCAVGSAIATASHKIGERKGPEKQKTAFVR
ncbi:MAG: hypothetical protein ACJ76V_01175, partial [Thermoleophilaceae bacterium]